MRGSPATEGFEPGEPVIPFVARADLQWSATGRVGGIQNPYKLIMMRDRFSIRNGAV